MAKRLPTSVSLSRESTEFIARGIELDYFKDRSHAVERGLRLLREEVGMLETLRRPEILAMVKHQMEQANIPPADIMSTPKSKRLRGFGK